MADPPGSLDSRLCEARGAPRGAQQLPEAVGDLNERHAARALGAAGEWGLRDGHSWISAWPVDFGSRLGPSPGNVLSEGRHVGWVKGGRGGGGQGMTFVGGPRLGVQGYGLGARPPTPVPRRAQRGPARPSLDASAVPKCLGCLLKHATRLSQPLSKHPTCDPRTYDPRAMSWSARQPLSLVQPGPTWRPWRPTCIPAPMTLVRLCLVRLPLLTSRSTAAPAEAATTSDACGGARGGG